MIGIVERKGSFSDRWIEYCQENQIPFRKINIYHHDLMKQCVGLKALLWNWSHQNYQDQIAARQIIYSLEYMGLIVFPNIRTCWHFDDKLAQKYLLEAVGAPLVPTYIFYSLDEALDWTQKADFPKVFKLRKGAGSYNVKLVLNKHQAQKLCKTAFNQGFNPIPRFLADTKTKVRKIKTAADILLKLKRMPKSLSNRVKKRIQFPPEKGYIYFQDFLPGNLYDTRVNIIGEWAFASTRAIRENDFRASGSGIIRYDNINLDMVKIAFEVTKKCNFQSVGFDFIYDKDKPVITEISYAYPAYSVRDCPGYWDTNMDWHQGHVRPQDIILEDILKLL